LYTDGLSEETKVITNKFNKNLMQKAYSKKWIDDISDLNLNLNPLNLLSDSVCYFNNKNLLVFMILKTIFF
jgi:hypothetical protein